MVCELYLSKVLFKKKKFLRLSYSKHGLSWSPG